MRDDLLDAQAAVDWTVAQLPAFHDRIEAWITDNVHVGVEDVPAPATHNPIVAVEKAPLPLSLNVEMGAYVNVIRSSLDILATALAHRHGIPRPDDAYFPVARSEAEFRSGNYKGSEFVKRLPHIDRGWIEALKPYQGGNETLWRLHQLDIMRKHRRLIEVEVRPLMLSVAPEAFAAPDFVRVATGSVRANEKTIIGLVRKGAPDYEMKFRAYIAVNEPGIVERRPVVGALYHFADHAAFIVKLFNAF